MSTEERCLLVLVEHGFLFYVSSTVNFEKLPADAKDVENQDDQTRHPKDLTQAARRRKELKRILVGMIHQTSLSRRTKHCQGHNGSEGAVLLPNKT